MKKDRIQIALVGNPNCGKSSIFNCLTGLNQQVGNFPGVTVDKKTGVTDISENNPATVIDLPGTYSLYPSREDEWVSYKVLLGQDRTLSPDVVVAVADASSLKRNLLFCTQIIDLKVPVVIALTMMDLAKRKGIKIDIATLERELGVPVIAVNPRKNKGISQLKKAIEQTARQLYHVPVRDFIDNKDKKILTYCTGGVRCEKLSGYLLKQGFKEVYQLGGGIIKYSKDTEVKGKMFDGKCKYPLSPN